MREQPVLKIDIILSGTVIALLSGRTGIGALQHNHKALKEVALRKE